MTLRTLPGIITAARRLGLEIQPTELREVLLTCPICRDAGLKALACITLEYGQPTVRCKGCEAWGDDPQNVLLILGHDPTSDDPHEIVLRIFGLLWAMHKHGQSTTTRTVSIRAIESGAQTPGKANPNRTGDPMAPTSITRYGRKVLASP